MFGFFSHRYRMKRFFWNDSLSLNALMNHIRWSGERLWLFQEGSFKANWYAEPEIKRGDLTSRVYCRDRGNLTESVTMVIDWNKLCLSQSWNIKTWNNRVGEQLLFVKKSGYVRFWKRFYSKCWLFLSKLKITWQLYITTYFMSKCCKKTLLFSKRFSFKFSQGVV